MSFAPQVDDTLNIGGKKYRFLQHPAAPGLDLVWGQTGRFGTVYAVEGPNNDLNAFKVFTASFQDPRYAETATQLQTYAALDALRVCERTVLTPEEFPDLLQQQPDLKYAVLMPWVTGQTWLEILYPRSVLSKAQSYAMATALTKSLARMEFWGIAHCDLSNTNVLLTQQPVSLGFVDVEGMFAPGLPKPTVLTVGSPGYAHRSAPAELWGPESDRFAGAVLLAEMLGWCDPSVRRQAYDATYFNPDEMPKSSSNGAANRRLEVLMESLKRNWGAPVGDAFGRAWESSSLAECPPMAEWDGLLDSASPKNMHILESTKVVVATSPPNSVEREPLPLYTPFPSDTGAPRRDGSGGWGWLKWIGIIVFAVLLLLYLLSLTGHR